MDESLILLDKECKLPLQAANGSESVPPINIVAYNGGALQLAGRYWPVIFDLESTVVAGSVPLLYAHDDTIQVGHTDSISIAVKSIRATGKLSGANERTEEIKASAKNGMSWQVSIGAVSKQIDFIDSQANVRVNGRTFQGPVYVARKNTLREISILPLGADDTTSASLSAKFHREGNKVNPLDEFITKAGFDPATVTDSQRMFFKAQYDEQQKKEVKNDSAINVDEIVNRVTTNLNASFNNKLERIDRINSLATEYNNPVMEVNGKKVNISAHAIKENWTVEKTEVEMMRAARPNVGAGGTGSETNVNGEVFCAALMQAGGLEDKNLQKQFKPEVLEAAHKKYKGRLGLQQFLLEAAIANGYRGSINVKANLKDVLRFAFLQASAFTTLEVPDIFTTNVNTFMKEGYNSVDDTWREISAIGSVSNFQEVTNLRVTGSMNFEKVAPDGHIPHGKLSTDDMGNKADTYGKMCVITRQDIINDNLGALTKIPRMLGRGGKLGLVRAFWTEFMNNSAFFVAGNNNVSSGALSAAGLAAARAVFAKLKDPAGEFINATAKILLVPDPLIETAEQLYVSDTLVGGSSALPDKNIMKGKYRPITTPYLTDTTITGNSATAYYLLADPNDVPVIEVVFLDGRQEPIVEQAEVDFSQLGVQMRGYWDWGVRKQDPNGGVRSTGV